MNETFHEKDIIQYQLLLFRLIFHYSSCDINIPIRIKAMKFYNILYQDKQSVVIVCVCYTKSGCLIICMSDHKSETPGSIGLKVWSRNLGEPRECS